MKMKLFYLAAAVFILQSCRAQSTAPLAQNKDDNSMLWEISAPGLEKPSYLFGTFHLMCKDDIHFSANLQQAIKTAREVYFEMKLDDPATTIGAMFYMNMKNGKALRDLYTPAEYERLQRFFSDSLKMNLSYFKTMKPMMLEALLYPRMLDCKNATGMEPALMVIAKKNGKAIKGLETIEFQASLFDSIPYEKQAKALLQDIDSTEKYKGYFNKMVHIYRSQETAHLTTLMSDTTFSEGEDDDLLLKKRNRAWLQQLKTILPKENIFMAVGAGHLFGKDGVIELLRREGYTVRPIENVK